VIPAGIAGIQVPWMAKALPVGKKSCLLFYPQISQIFAINHYGLKVHSLED